MKQDRRRKTTLVPLTNAETREVEGLLQEALNSMARCLVLTAFVVEALEAQDTNPHVREVAMTERPS